MNSYPDNRRGPPTKQWAKLVTGVNNSKKGGFKFEGDFLGLDRHHEAEWGSIVLRVAEWGEPPNVKKVGELLRVLADGSTEVLITKEGHGWAVLLAREAARLMLSADPEFDELRQATIALAGILSRRKDLLRVTNLALNGAGWEIRCLSESND